VETRTDNFIYRLIRFRWLQHLLFWFVSMVVLVNLMKVSADIKTIDWVYALVFHLVILLPVYINLLILVPRLMAKNRYLLFLFALALNLMLGIGFYFFVFGYLVDWILPGYYFVAVYDVIEIGLILSAYLIMTLLLKLARAWFFVSKIEKESTRHQLEALKLQVNPHFLFNTLSSIYSLARKKSDMTLGVILQLSDIMRYMIYETNTEQVELIKELELINNILEIHQVRFGEALLIEKKIVGDINEIKVAPLLFIPFIENAMKYCSPSPDGNYSIEMNFIIEKDRLKFQISNSYSASREEIIEKGGIGLENAQKRLSLLYPERHWLTILDDKSLFKVELILNLN
jgi:two-component system, LytTR family, sensor kinase